MGVLVALLLLAAPLGPTPYGAGEGIIGHVFPPARRVVTVSGGNVRVAVVTTDDGWFTFVGLPAGRYQLQTVGGGAPVEVQSGRAAVIEWWVFNGPWTGTSEPSRIDPERSVPAGLRFEASLPRRLYLRGEPIALTGRVINEGRRPIALMRLVEGSDWARRFPHYLVTVRDYDRRTVWPAFWGLRCGTVNRLVPKDNFVLAPGTSADPVVLPVCSALPAGKYTVSMKYAHDGSEAAGGFMPERVIGLVSNEVELEVTDSPEALGIPLQHMPPEWQPELTQLSGRVVTALGRPVAGLAVSINPSHARTKTDFDGRYAVRVLPGRYELSLGKDMQIVTLADRDVVVDFRQRAFRRLCVNVEGEERMKMVLVPGLRPMPGRFADVELAGLRRYERVTDGRWCFSSVPSGKHTLFVARDEGVTRMFVDVAPDADREVDVD